MGQIKGKVNGNAGSYVNYYIEYTLNSQSVENNTSNITLKHYAQATSTAAGAYNNNSGSGGCLSKLAYQGISGLYDYVVNRYQTVDFRNKKLVDLGSWTGDVKHLDDGSLTIDLLAEFDTNGPASVTTGSASGSWELPTIPRASSFSSSNGTIEGSATININSASSSFTHTITYNFGNKSETIASGLKGTNISYAWAIPSTLYAQIPNSKSGTCTLTVITYNGSTEVGRKSGTITIGTSEEKCKPSVGGSIVDINSATVALTGDSSKLIRYKSTAKVTGTATAKNAASIKSILVDGGSTNPLTVYNVSKNSFTVKATDSRLPNGYSNSTTISATMIPYVNLTCSALFKRKTQTGDEIILNYSGNYYNGSFGATNNTLTMSWAWRHKGATDWNTGGTLTPTISGNTYSGSISCGTGYDYKKNYEFIVYYKDKLNDLNTGVISVPKGQGSLEIYEDGIKLNGDFLSRIGFKTEHLYHNAPGAGEYGVLSAPDSSVTLDCNFADFDLLLIRFSGRTWGWLQKYEVILVGTGLGYDYYSTENLYCVTMSVYGAPEYPMSMQYYITNNNTITVFKNSHYTQDNHLYIKDIFGVKFKN